MVGGLALGSGHPVRYLLVAMMAATHTIGKDQVEVRMAPTPGRVEIRWLTGVRQTLGWFEHPEEFVERNFQPIEKPEPTKDEYIGLAGLLLAIHAAQGVETRCLNR